MANGEPTLSATDRLLVLTPAANSHRRDFDFVFKPESDKLKQCYVATGAQCQVVPIPVAPVDAKTLTVQGSQQAFEAAAGKVIAAVANGTSWTHVIVLCHGWPTGLQLGFRTGKQRGNDARLWQELVGAFKAVPLKTVALFACSAGKEPITRTGSPGTGDGSLADRLRDEVGATVIAHTTVGHATRNPFLITFERSSSPLIGGLHLAPRGTALFKRARALLSNERKVKNRPAPGDLPPQGHSRPAFASIPLCQSAVELQALMSAEPTT